jgi:hypothetical protein
MTKNIFNRKNISQKGARNIYSALIHKIFSNIFNQTISVLNYKTIHSQEITD